MAKETVYYLDDNFVRVINSSGTFDFTYVQHEGQLVAQQNPDGSKLFVHGDHLGSTNVVTNEAGDVVENTTYEPFGNIIEGGEQSRYEYTSQEYDSVIGDYDYHARRYNAEWGIFTQPDTLIPNIYDPQQLNHYSYARNNPYRYDDKTGRSPILLLVGGIVLLSASIGFIYGFSENVAIQYGKKEDWHSVDFREAAKEGGYSALVASVGGLISIGSIIGAVNFGTPFIGPVEGVDSALAIGTILEDIHESNPTNTPTNSNVQNSQQEQDLAKAKSKQSGTSNSKSSGGSTGSKMTYSQWSKTSEGKNAWATNYKKLCDSLEKKRAHLNGNA